MKIVTQHIAVTVFDTYHMLYIDINERCPSASSNSHHTP